MGGWEGWMGGMGDVYHSVLGFVFLCLLALLCLFCLRVFFCFFACLLCVLSCLLLVFVCLLNVCFRLVCLFRFCSSSLLALRAFLVLVVCFVFFRFVVAFFGRGEEGVVWLLSPNLNS